MAGLLLLASGLATLSCGGAGGPSPDGAQATVDAPATNTSDGTATDTAVDVTGNEASSSTRMLRADGTSLKDSAGNVVTLRGVNLGGWLVTENWMCGITDSTDAASGRFTIETLEERFGAARAKTLIDAWRDAFLTTADLDEIHALGFNVVRVPFGYRNLQDANGVFLRNAAGQVDFSRMDWLVTQAAARGLYVIYDLHIWRGQEKGRTSQTGSAGNALVTAAYDHITCGADDVEKAAQQAAAIELWQAIIEHYRGNGDIAAFELINEACGGAWGSVFLYDALRAVDPDRVFVIWGTPYDAIASWTNVVFGPHQYDIAGPTLTDDQTTIATDIAGYANAQQKYGVPYYAGELHVFTADPYPSLALLLSSYAQHGISWTEWTFKGVNVGDWALENWDTSVAVDVAYDSYETILASWASLATTPTRPSSNLKAVLSQAAVSH